MPAKSKQVENPPLAQAPGSADPQVVLEPDAPLPTDQPEVPHDSDEVEMWAPGEAAPARQQVYVPVHCRVCDTRMYATPAQVGSDITCPDCGAKTQVKRVVGQSPSAAPLIPPGEEYELFEAGPALTMETLGYGSQKSQAQDSVYDISAVTAAARVEHALRQARNSPPKDWMLRGVFLYPLRVSVWGNTLLIACLGVAALCVGAGINGLSTIPYVAILAVFLIVILAGLTMFTAALLGALLIAVIEVASDGQDAIEDEFDLMFADRVLRFLFVLFAWVYAAAPGMLVGLFIKIPAAWQPDWPSQSSLFAVISLFVLLPWTQLSVLEATSLVVPISSQLLRAARRNPLAWLAFYLVSFPVLAVAVGLIALASHLFIVVAWWLSFCIAVLALVLYYRLLGRLAWYCAAHTEPREEPKKADPYEPLYP